MDDVPQTPEPSPDQPGEAPGDPLFGLGDMKLSDLARMLQSSGPVNWEVARQVATMVALDGRPEAAIEPGAATQLEELSRAAQTYVVGETGLALSSSAPLLATGRQAWTELHLNSLRPVLEALAVTFGRALPAEDAESAPGPPTPLDPAGGVMGMLAPLLLGVQSGSMVGYLAQHALGRYDLPLPASDEPSLCFVVPNLDAFQDAWSLDADDLRFTVALHEVVHATERSIPWVRERMAQLAVDYVSAYEVDATVLRARLGDIDPMDPTSLESLAEHPEEVLGAMQSPRQRELLAEARVFHAVLEGYADHVLDRIGRRLIPTFGRVHEALKRHRVDRGKATRLVEQLLGLTLERGDYDQGIAFCDGVVERAGEETLQRLWQAPAMAPTRSELEAPGLWLARVDLGT